MNAPIISFLSDYGTTDEFVGVVHSVLADLTPQTKVIDITHGIDAYDIRAGSLALARSVEYLCPGVVLAVVDPGVGSDRRPVAVEVGGGQSVLVGPDNGLLAPAVAMVGGASRAVVLNNTAIHLAGDATTFDGRDIFAPAAAHLANGGDLTDLGELIDPGTLVPGVVPVAHSDTEGLHAEVLWIDQFGNAQLNIGPEDLPGPQAQITVAGRPRTATQVTGFDQVGPGKLGLMVDASGLIALVVARASAAADLGVSCGDPVLIAPAGQPPASSTTGTPVALTQREEN